MYRFKNLYFDDVFKVVFSLISTQLRISWCVQLYFDHSCLNYVGCKVIHDNLFFMHGSWFACINESSSVPKKRSQEKTSQVNKEVNDVLCSEKSLCSQT